jgi:hypothetical protein
MLACRWGRINDPSYKSLGPSRGRGELIEAPTLN